MRVARIEVKRYRLALATPIRMAGIELNAREGALVRVVSEAGATGWGDCAPIPGLSRESLWGALQEIEAASGYVSTCEIGSYDGLAVCSRSMKGLSPSARFALESAIASAAAEEAGITVGDWLLGASADRCAVNALATGAPETWAEAASRAISEKFRVLKIKVGRNSMGREVRALFEAASGAPGLQFRLDANRAWSVVTACAFAREVERLPVEYIEEPFAGAFVMPPEWPERPGLAMDESLWGVEDPPEPRPPVVAWVLKPTLVGGLVRAIGLAMRARRAGCEAVWSAAYESGVGIRMLAELGGALGGAAGLDTLRALREDVLEPRLEIANGAIDLCAARRSAVAL